MLRVLDNPEVIYNSQRRTKRLLEKVAASVPPPPSAEVFSTLHDGTVIDASGNVVKGPRGAGQ